jgi:predicted oxidoreductase
MPTTVYQADVIIVGAGIAGIITAIELLDAGKRVLLLDRDLEKELGGLAKWAFGGMFFVDTKHQRRNGIKDSIELARKDWYSFADFTEEEHWGKLWADQYLHLCTDQGYSWLRKNGIKFFPVLNWAERGLNKDGNSVPRFHMVWGTGWELVQVFKRKLLHHRNKHLLQIHYQHRVQDFIGNSAGVSGVHGLIENTGAEFTATAETVVVATGGINGNLEKVRNNWFPTWGKAPEVLLNGAHKYALGDLHEATTAIDGNVVNLDKQWNYAAGIRHYAPRKEEHGLSLVPCKTALWLNHKGERMGPTPLVTAFDTRYLVERICQEEKKYSWQVLNYRIMLKEFAISGSEHNPPFRDKKIFQVLKTVLFGNKKLVNKIIDKCEDVIVANTLEELVTRMNALAGSDEVQLQTVKTAVEDYDAKIEKGPPYTDEQQQRIFEARQWRGDKARTANMAKIGDPEKGPFVAIREFILSRKSLGGIQTNLSCQVLTQPDASGEQSAIPGLYAIGEAAGFGGGGMHGLRSLEGTFLGACVITARVASQAILEKKLSS